MSAPHVPFSRPLYGPDGLGAARHSTPGLDVLALKRALWRCGLFEGPAEDFDQEYNRKAVAAVQTLQRHAHIQATGHVGLATWEALRLTRPEKHPGEWAFDQTAIDLAVRSAKAYAETPRQKVQHAGVDAANYWILHRNESDYSWRRPFPVVKPPHVPAGLDCSGHATLVYYAGGAPDPNGRGYDGRGYTGTLMGRGERTSRDRLALLDLVFYGFTTNPSPAFPYGSPTHVAVYIGGGYVSSDGSQAGPEKRDADYRRTIHSVRRYPLV